MVNILRYALWIERLSRTTYFFDSYGMLSNNQYIVSFIRKNSKQTFWNRRRLQSFYSYCCGGKKLNYYFSLHHLTSFMFFVIEYCLVFAYTIALGEALECFMNQFSTKYYSNDEKVRSLYQCIYNEKCAQSCTSFFSCIQNIHVST